MKLGRIHFLLRSGKNRKFPYYANCLLRYLLPRRICRTRLARELSALQNRDDGDAILQRVNYYNRLSPEAKLSDNPRTVGEFRLRGQSRRACSSTYFFDAYEFLRSFPTAFRWEYCPGDVTHVPPFPTVVKSRPLVQENQNSVLLKLNKIRHFIFVEDDIPFREKESRVLFRGKVAHKPSRIAFMQKFFGHPLCDAGDVSGCKSVPAAWKAPKLTLSEQLRYKFILAIEGNDVASNLKWVMSSNSIAVMPRPTCETWFMEGALIPNVHYIEIKPDFSDLEERVRYYDEHPEEAEKIIENAHRHVELFKDETRERLISLLVLQKYFRCTGQPV